MALKTITKKVVSYCEIPEEIIKPSWIEEAECDVYVEYHLEGTPDGGLDTWLMENYPELAEEDSFFIHIDY